MSGSESILVNSSPQLFSQLGDVSALCHPGFSYFFEIEPVYNKLLSLEMLCTHLPVDVHMILEVQCPVKMDMREDPRCSLIHLCASNGLFGSHG